jgi:dienelactone hydrolase
MSRRANPVLAVGSLLLVPSVCPAGDLAFRRHVLAPEAQFCAACAFDVNRDGKVDIICGDSWYEAPTWKRHPVRTVEVINGRPDGFAHLPLDVNGDGWTDVVTVNFRSRSIKWIEHPGSKLGPWKTHVVDEPGPMETGRLVDVDGDGQLDILPNGANFAAWWSLDRKPGPKGGFTPVWTRHELPRELAGHGLGFGDVNGDGRGDIVGRFGWAEAPPDRRAGRWVWHPDFDLDPASIPVLVVDVNGDGLNDIVYTRGHHFGVYWLEQTRTKDNEIRWVKHVIDTSWAGAHAPLWADLDGDGTPELIVGKRYMAHEGRDPGEYDPLVGYRYQYDRGTRTWRRWLITYDDHVGFGLDPKAVDLNGDGRLDLLCADRDGLYWLENLGPPKPGAAPADDPARFPTYTDREKLLVVKDAAGKERPVETPFDWGRRRAHIVAAIERVTGPLPDPSHRVPLDVRVVEETPVESYVRKKITYAADPGGRVPAYILVPNRPRTNRPAVLCLHDATPAGKDEPAGLAGRKDLHLAHELAKRGYVCLVPDYPSAGEYRYDFKAAGKSYASGAMKAVWDNVRGIDLLESLPEVNVNRIGVIGHGTGGHGALLTAAFDQRLAAVVSSAGFTTFTKSKGGLADWAHERSLPRLREAFGGDPARVPFDFGEVLAAVAPRPVFVSAPLKDEVYDVEGVKAAVAAAAAVYKFRRADRSLRVVYPDAGHEFPDATRAEAFAWLDQLLRP